MPRGGKRENAGRKPKVPKGIQAPPIEPPKYHGGSLYRPEYAEQATKLCRLGATDIELADFFKVGARTIYTWANAHEEFAAALKTGKEMCDERVERSLYHRAVGYTHEAVKIMAVKGEVQIVPYREHVPPETAAARLWLINRRPDVWRDKQEVSHKMDDLENLPSEERQHMLEAIRAEAERRRGETQH